MYYLGFIHSRELNLNSIHAPAIGGNMMRHQQEDMARF